MTSQRPTHRFVHVAAQVLAAGLLLTGCAATPRAAIDGNAGPPHVRPESACVLDHVASRIPPSGASCSAVGRSYSSDDIGRTGATTTGQALQLLDPSITVGH